jgi:hypothetical protein
MSEFMTSLTFTYAPALYEHLRPDVYFFQILNCFPYSSNIIGACLIRTKYWDDQKNEDERKKSFEM